MVVKTASKKKSVTPQKTRKQKGGSDDNAYARSNTYSNANANANTNANANARSNSYSNTYSNVNGNSDYEDDFELDVETFNQEDLQKFQDLITKARDSNTSKDNPKIRSCTEIQTLDQHEFGVCYYASLLHCMFFSKGMRTYVGRQIKLLESNLIASSNHDDPSWYFIRLWSMINRPTFYKEFDWSTDLCYHLGHSLVASLKVFDERIECLKQPPYIRNENGLQYTIGYEAEVEHKGSLEKVSKGGRTGETLQPVLCTLGMKNVLFMSLINYDYQKQQTLIDLLSKRIKTEKSYNRKIDIIALLVTPDREYIVEEDQGDKFAIAETLLLDNETYHLDAMQFRNIPTPGVGHAIAGITCPHMDAGKSARLVLNSWNDNDVHEIDWTKEHIVIDGYNVDHFSKYTDAVNKYNSFLDNDKTREEDGRTELNNMIFSPKQARSLYFFTRKETDAMDNIDLMLVQENIKSKASMIFGQRPIGVHVDGDGDDIFLGFPPQSKAALQQVIANIGLPEILLRLDIDTRSMLVVAMNYKKFVELCQQKMGLVEDILVITGQAPLDVVRDEVNPQTFYGGGLQNAQIPPPPPGMRTRTSPSTSAASVSILARGPKVNVNASKSLVYFGVVNPVPDEVLNRYRRQYFSIEKVDTSKGVISLKTNKGPVERLLKPNLHYYRFDYQKYSDTFLRFEKADLVVYGGKSKSRKATNVQKKTKITKGTKKQ